MTAETQAKAVEALAQWEKLKAKNGVKSDSALLEVLERKAVAVEEAWDVILEDSDLDDLAAAFDGLDYDGSAGDEGKGFSYGDEPDLADPDEVVDLMLAAVELKQAAGFDELLDRRAALESPDFP